MLEKLLKLSYVPFKPANGVPFQALSVRDFSSSFSRFFHGLTLCFAFFAYVSLPNHLESLLDGDVWTILMPGNRTSNF